MIQGATLALMLALNFPGLISSAGAQPPAATDELPRRGVIGLGIAPSPDGGLPRVAAIRPGSGASLAGVKVGDLLVNVAGKTVANNPQLAEAIRTFPSGAKIDVIIRRDGKDETKTIELQSVGVEVVPGSVTRYSSVLVPQVGDVTSHRLRTIITEPEKSPLANADGKVPAFFFIQGLQCQTLDRPMASTAVDTRLVHAMAEAGYTTIRVDKAGLGDSQGPPCESINFQTELAGYEATLQQLLSLPSVDPKRIYVFGHSMGGVMAPYLMDEGKVAGAIVYGTAVRTWFEYALENTRRQMSLSGASATEINAALQAEAKLNATVLLEKKTLGDFWAKYPQYKEENPMMTATTMWGRHVGFFHQLQDLNLAEAWTTAQGSVLAIHGEYDWVTSKIEHDEIAAIVNKRSPGQGTSLQLTKADHGFTTHETLQASLTAMAQGTWDERLPQEVLKWIRTVESR
jgi:uncharacterized protein